MLATLDRSEPLRGEERRRRKPVPFHPGGAAPSRGAPDAPGVPGALDRADLPFPAEDERGPLRMLVITGLGGLGFWIVVGFLVL